jgi:hypothetical protein
MHRERRKEWGAALQAPYLSHLIIVTGWRDIDQAR